MRKQGYKLPGLGRIAQRIAGHADRRELWSGSSWTGSSHGRRARAASRSSSTAPARVDNTLVILDEIQACPKALTSLKYFCEEAPEYYIAAAGTLLGLTIHEGSGYPVGKVDTLDLYPLHFREFLAATGNQPLRELIDSGDTSLINSFASKFVPLLRQYYYVGGMPESVSVFLESGLLEDVRSVQREILRGYELDISKHLGRTETEYALAAWWSIPAHLGRENKKFVFSHIAQGARAQNYRSGITWLTQAGIATWYAGCPSRGFR